MSLEDNVVVMAYWLVRENQMQVFQESQKRILMGTAYSLHPLAETYAEKTHTITYNEFKRLYGQREGFQDWMAVWAGNQATRSYLRHVEEEGDAEE